MLIELKQGKGSEREAMTELCGYSSGLNSIMPGLSKYDAIWIPISEEWAQNVIAAVNFQSLVRGQFCVPLRHETQWDGDDVADLKLNIVDIPIVDDEFAYSIFAEHSVDGFVYSFWKDRVPEGNEVMFDWLLQRASVVGERYGLHGFATIQETDDTYELLVAVSNAHKAALKQAQLREVMRTKGELEMHRTVKEWLGPDYDWGYEFDFKDHKLKSHLIPIEDGLFKTPDVEDYFRLGELAHGESNSIGLLAQRLAPYFEQFGGAYELNTVAPLAHLKSTICVSKHSVSYFGLLADFALERLEYEFKNGQQTPEGMCGPSLEELTSLSNECRSKHFLIELLQLLNFEHECQYAYIENI